MRIAFLLTCYNRKEITIRCIKNLLSQIDRYPEYNCSIIVCDDASTDGTVECIKEKYPQVDLICTKGNNFWCKGMYIAMQHAYIQKYDLYFMINDDVDFFDNMLEIMLASYVRSDKLSGIVGTTVSKITSEVTYGGRVSEFDLSFVLPCQDLKECGVANWNCFLIPHKVIEVIGLIDSKYAHSFGDFDYSMAMGRNGIPIYVASDYIGYCERNGIEGTFQDKRLGRVERLKKMHGRKGIPLYSLLRYYIKNFGIHYGVLAIYSYLKNLKDILLGK